VLPPAVAGSKDPSAAKTFADRMGAPAAVATNIQASADNSGGSGGRDYTLFPSAYFSREEEAASVKGRYTIRVSSRLEL
jgi:hypothetical protein